DPMCVDNDSRPPIPPIAGGSAGSRDFRLTSADGTRFMAHAARAGQPTGAGMVVIPDVRGLHPYYKELADRLAEVGVDAVAIGFFGWPLGLSRWPDRPKPIDAVSRYKCGVLSLFGGADQGIPQTAVDEFDAACRKAGVKHDSTVYPGAPHSFFDRKQTEFAEA